MATSDCKILSLTLSYNNQSFAGEINESKRTIVVKVPYGTPLYTTDESGAEVGVLGLTVTASKGATSTPGTGALISYKNSVRLSVVAADGQTNQAYTLTVKVLPDATPVGMHKFRQVGWSNLRYVTGNLGAYETGGIPLALGNFKPKVVIGVQVDKGKIGFYDLNTNRLRVYNSAGTETSADETCEFTIVLMGE